MRSRIKKLQPHWRDKVKRCSWQEFTSIWIIWKKDFPRTIKVSNYFYVQQVILWDGRPLALCLHKQWRWFRAQLCQTWRPHYDKDCVLSLHLAVVQQEVLRAHSFSLNCNLLYWHCYCVWGFDFFFSFCPAPAFIKLSQPLSDFSSWYRHGNFLSHLLTWLT